MFGKKTTRNLFAAVFAVLTVGAMALFFSFYDPWLPTGSELIPDGSFSTPAATNGWTGWNQWAQLVPDGGFKGSPGVVLTAVSNTQVVLRFGVPSIRGIAGFRVSLRAAASGVQQGKEGWNLPRALFFYRDAQTKGMFSIPHQVFSAEEDRLWETHIAFFPVPAGAADARFYLQNLGYAGTLRVDDISITPAQARAGTPWWKAFFGLLWFTAAGFSLTVLKLWKRRLGWAICVTVVLILIGALLPGEVLDGGIEQTGQTIQRLSEKLLPPEPAAVAPAGKPAPPKPSAPKEEKPPLFTGEEAFDNAHFIGHFTLFSLLALLTAISWFSGKPPLRLAAAVFTGLTLFACATEVLQFITPDRSASLYDVRTDLAGMAIVILLIFAAVHIRRIVFAAKNKPCPSP